MLAPQPLPGGQANALPIISAVTNPDPSNPSLQPAQGQQDLHELLRNASPQLSQQVFVFCSLTEEGPLGSLEPICTFVEEEGITAIVPRERAAAHGLSVQPAWALITLAVHSSLQAVGFLAHVTAALAEVGIAVNVVSAYHHDHLFVPAHRSAEAMSVLQSGIPTAAA